MRLKLSTLMVLATLVMASAMLYLAMFQQHLLSSYAAFLSFILLLFVVGIILARFEESEISSKEVALIGILGAIIAASRIPFVALPNIQPCTFLIICTGLIFGSLAGAMAGVTTAAVSNFFFGHGPWTPWMMVAWGMVGIISALVGKRLKDEVTVTHVIFLGVILGLAYNLLMDFSSWLTFYRAVPDLFIPTMVAGIPYGILHVVGNVIFAAVLGRPVLTLFKRFRRRTHVSYRPEDGHRAGLAGAMTTGNRTK
ncbi:MAG TPA: ECF transporter S component [Euryarchaeota archaeon]|jgi:energy-coupling factor transport system substrate-specific component|nr:ECF transporter S component [Euryarchaeota archaeon]HOB39323.1 ECF transporter S component [Methanomassiliicoccaceae archaeon]